MSKYRPPYSIRALDWAILAIAFVIVLGCCFIPPQ